MLGITVLLVVTAANFFIGKLIKTVEEKEMKAADERLGIIRQVSPLAANGRHCTRQSGRCCTAAAVCHLGLKPSALVAHSWALPGTSGDTGH